MKARRPANPYPGYRCEYAARYALSAYASVVPIPLQEDYGHDLYCLLTQRQGTSLIPLYPFVVQVKKNDSGSNTTIEFDDKDGVEWFFNFGLPFLIALGYLDESPRIDIYKTSERIPLKLMHGTPDRVSLNTFEKQDDPEKLYDKNTIWLGKPIITIGLKDSGKPNDDIADALNFWVQLEIENLIFQSNNISTYYRCKKYETNKCPEDSEIVRKDFYNTGGLSGFQKEKFGSIIYNMALWQFMGSDGESPKITWGNLDVKSKRLYDSFYHVLSFLSESISGELSAKLDYPEPNDVTQNVSLDTSGVTAILNSSGFIKKL